MSRRLILVLALAFVLGISFAAYAEVQNVKVSGDIEVSGIGRWGFDLRHNDTLGTNSNFLLNQTRVRVDADLTDNVSATFRLLNERAWGNTISTGSGSENDDEIWIDLAYATLKEFLYSPVTLTVGRQELHFGNDMIIGDMDTNRIATTWTGQTTTSYVMPAPDLSKKKAFDAVRLTLNYDPLVIDAIYSRINERFTTRRDNNTDLYGVNARYDFGNILGTKSLIGEAYWFGRTTGRKAFAQGNKEDRVDTIGGRIEVVPINNLRYQLEVAKQIGTYTYSNATRTLDVTVPRDAWAIETSLTYDFKKIKYNPTLTGLYAYFSGDKDSYWFDTAGDAHNLPHSAKGWDPMYENQSFGHIANALLPQTNAHIAGLIVTAKPWEDVNAKLEYYSFSQKSKRVRVK